jgi:endonuclease-3
LKNAFSSWEEVAQAKRSTIERLIKVAGLAPAKSKAIKNLLVKLQNNSPKLSLDFLQEFSNEEAINKLTEFGGVGVKTASCVLLFSLNRDVCPVDTHVHRVLNRLGIVKTKTPEKTFWQINQNFPNGIAHSFHTNLILLGREICTPTKPKCKICPLQKICNYQEKNFEDKSSSAKKRILLLDNIGI